MRRESFPGTSKFYLYGDYVKMEENIRTEFKGHDSLSVENIDPKEIDQKTMKTSKKPISRTICCFLNTLQGGSIYLGILDSGRVKGLEMSEDQREHFMTNLKDTLLRFSPPVEDDDRIRVCFIPVLYLGPDDDPHEAYNSFNKGEKSTDLLSHVHLVRSCKPCWCLKNARHQMNAGFSQPAYIIKLTIMPFNMEKYIATADANNLTCIPIYRNEEELSFIRGQASQQQLTLKDVFQRSRQNAKLVAKSMLKSRQAYLDTLRRKLSGQEPDDCKLDENSEESGVNLSDESSDTTPSSQLEENKTASNKKKVIPSKFGLGILCGGDNLDNVSLNKSKNKFYPNEDDTNHSDTFPSVQNILNKESQQAIAARNERSINNHFNNFYRNKYLPRKNSFARDFYKRSVSHYKHQPVINIESRGNTPGSYPTNQEENSPKSSAISSHRSRSLILESEHSSFKPFGIFPGFDYNGKPLAHEQYVKYSNRKISIYPESATRRPKCSINDRNIQETPPPISDQLNETVEYESVQQNKENVKNVSEPSPMTRLQRSLLILSGQSP